MSGALSGCQVGRQHELPNCRAKPIARHFGIGGWQYVTNIARISVQYVFRMNKCAAQVLSSHIEH